MLEFVLLGSFLVVTLQVAELKAQATSQVDYYEKLITDSINNANAYVDPVNAKQYEGNYYENATEEDFGTFDFVVIGAGSSGAVIASRLSEVKNWTVLLLEAGKRENKFTDIPALALYSRFSDYNWGFVSVPQEGACQGMVEKRCPFPRGKALGGSSVLNGMICARGNHKDFDLWNSKLTKGSWSYKDVLPYFKKSENMLIPNLDPYYHGYNGPLPINEHVPTSLQTLAFLEAYKELGVNLTDINGRKELGVSLTPLITRNGSRVSTAAAYLNETKENLRILPGAYVTRILTRNRRAYAVEFTYQASKSIAKVSKEVILSAGVFGSPTILMHSGIGPGKALRKHGIPIVKNLPNIGKNLKDHPTFYGMTFNSNCTEPIKDRREYIKEYLSGRGPYTIPANLQGISFHKTKLSQYWDIPDIELLFVASNSTGPAIKRALRLTNETYEAVWGCVDPTSSFLVYIILLKPRSDGCVTLQSANPFDYAWIDPKFLTDKEDLDIERIYLGVQHVLELTKTQAFQKINASLHVYTFPACNHTQYLSKEYWFCTIRQFTVNIYHPMGTCAMMDRKFGGVVDGELKLYGIEGLRVADTSVIPVLSGHPHAAAVMIGEKAADIIKKNYRQV